MSLENELQIIQQENQEFREKEIENNEKQQHLEGIIEEQ